MTWMRGKFLCGNKVGGEHQRTWLQDAGSEVLRVRRTACKDSETWKEPVSASPRRARARSAPWESCQCQGSRRGSSLDVTLLR